MAYIYKITNSINKKIYVGKTKNAVSICFSQHKTDSKNPRMNHTHLYRAMQKYGQDNFIVEVLEECPEKILNEREKFGIAKLDSQNPMVGYNETAGGDGGQTSKKVGNEREVLQLDISTLQVLNRYSSLSKAAQALSLDKSCSVNIGACCRGKQKTAYGYKGVYANESIDKNKLSKNNDKTRAVLQFDKKTLEKITEFQSVADAAEFITKNKKQRESNYSTTIASCARNECFSAYGYCGLYSDLFEQGVRKKTQRPRGIVQMDKDKNIIKVYDTIAEAERAMGTSENYLGSKTKRKTEPIEYKGFLGIRPLT